MRYANESFSPTFITTIGIDFKIKIIQLDHKRVKLQIWDTAGQERFRTITTSYFRGAQGILLVYDVTDILTFQNITNWMSQIQQHADVCANKILIGNKRDDSENRVVAYERGKELADQYKISFFETSAKQEVGGVEEAFLAIAHDVKERLLKGDGVGSTNSNVNLSQNQNITAKKSCC